jgi:hypothetical protein
MERFKPAKYNTQQVDSSIKQSTAAVIGNMNRYFAGKEEQVSQLADYIVNAMKAHWDEAQLVGTPDNPANGEYWHNRTYVAATNMFFRSYHFGKNIGFYGYYGSAVYYATTLEAYKQGLTRVMASFSQLFLEGVERIYGGKVTPIPRPEVDNEDEGEWENPYLW